MISKKISVYLAGMIAALVGILVGMGRHFWCQVEDYLPWSWDTVGPHNSQHLLDPYSFTHIEHGFVFFALTWVIFRFLSSEGNTSGNLGLRFAIALTIAGAWEVLENSNWIIDKYRAQTVDAGYYGDSIFNSMADLGWCALGFWFASKFKWYWTLLLMILFEVTLAFTIRDNLLFNIIMLTFPIDALLDWQKQR